LTVVARWRRWLPRGGSLRSETADRVVLIALALVALKFANFQEIWPTIPGRAALYANDALELCCYLAFVVLIALSCRSVPPDCIGRRHPGRILVLSPVDLILQRVIRPLPSDLFLAATAAAMALIVFWGRRRPSWRVSAGVLTLAAFWLSWRSLDEYMAQVPLLAVGAILALLAGRDLRSEPLGSRQEVADAPRVTADVSPYRRATPDGQT
jgi:hypothetical protein